MEKSQMTMTQRLAGSIDDTRETVSQFMDKISVAKMNGMDHIEASQAIIDHYNRRGLGGAKYFFFHGIKVYLEGTIEESDAADNAQLGPKIHGASEGVVIS